VTQRDRAPGGLGREGRALWRAVTAEIVLETPAERRWLADACRLADRAAVLAAAIERDGHVIPGRWGPILNPAIAEERRLRTSCAALLARIEVAGAGEQAATASELGRRLARSRWQGRVG
jgi:hypothetical protein